MHELEFTDLDKLAQTIDMHGGVDINIAVCWEEWNTEDGIPVDIPTATIDGYHSIPGVDYTLYKTQKAIVAENHWNPNDTDSIGQTGQVILTEDFLKHRGTNAMFQIPIDNTPLFPRTLKLGMKGDDVKELQTLLGIKSDGSFGPITFSHVELFQTLHGLVM